MKTPEEYFVDWEASAFGFGYGTGEPYTLRALKSFFGAIGRDDAPDSYDHTALEATVSPAVAWLLINRLCMPDLDVIEYGTSPRYGWLTRNGVEIKNFLASKTAEEMEAIICDGDKDGICMPNHCNCGEVKCRNPFWPIRCAPKP